MDIWLIIAITVLGAYQVLGDTVLKAAGQGQGNWWILVITGALIYATTTPGWYLIFKESKLVVLQSVYTITQAILLILIGCLYFHENLSLREWAGVVLGLLAMILLAKKS